jgi:hypothetical protein
MAALAVCFALCFSTAGGKVTSETERWQREVEYEVSRLDYSNRVEKASCKNLSFVED